MEKKDSTGGVKGRRGVRFLDRTSAGRKSGDREQRAGSRCISSTKLLLPTSSSQLGLEISVVNETHLTFGRYSSFYSSFVSL